MMSDSGSGVESSPVQNISAQYGKIHRAYQQVLDRWTPFVLYRWLATAGLLFVFLLRIVLAQGVSPYSLLSSFARRNEPDSVYHTVVHWFVCFVFFPQRFSNLTWHHCIQYAVRWMNPPFLNLFPN